MMPDDPFDPDDAETLAICVLSLLAAFVAVLIFGGGS